MSDTTNIYYQEEIDGDYTVRRKDGTILIEDLEEDEARKIVCRWNSHDALLKACKEVRLMLNTDLKDYKTEPWAMRVEAAIAQAEKEG